MPIYKRVEHLTPDDFHVHPVWEFALDMEGVDGFDETVMRPAMNLPVHDLGNHVVGTRVHLANGAEIWAMLGRIHLQSVEETRRFANVSLRIDDDWFSLARPHEIDWEDNGPVALARALNLPIDEVFPIAYDISAWCVGEPDAVRGVTACDPPAP